MRTPTIRRLDPAPGLQLWRVSSRDAGGCAWCGEGSRWFVYYRSADDARRAVRTESVDLDEAHCSLHCWGQAHGWVEL